MTGMVVALAGFVGLVLLLLVTGKLPPPGMHLAYIPAYFLIVFMFMTPLAMIMSILGTQLRPEICDHTRRPGPVLPVPL